MSEGSIVFDRAAGFYDQTRGFPNGEEKDVAALIAKAGRLNTQSHLLEVGVGTGRISVPLTQHVGHVYGVDLSVPMMGRIRQKPGGEHVRPIQADAGRLPFAPDTFDAVVVVHVFHLIPDANRPIDEIARVLKPDGCLLHGWNSSHEGIFGELRRVFSDVTHKTGSRKAWESTTPLLLEKGWSKADVQHSFDYDYEASVQGFLDTFRTRKWSATWDVDDAELQKGIQAMQAAAQEKFPDFEQPIRMTNSFHLDVFTPPA